MRKNLEIEMTLLSVYVLENLFILFFSSTEKRNILTPKYFLTRIELTLALAIELTFGKK